MRTLVRLFVCLAGLGLGAGTLPAAAEEAPAERFITGDWRLPATPYLWALTGDGEATAGAAAGSAELGFVDLLGTLDHGGSSGASSEATSLGLGGYVRLGPWSLDGTAGNAGTLLVIDPYAGLRSDGLDPGLAGSSAAATGEDWATPFVGARTVLQFTPRWSMTALGDVGSDYAWQAAGLVGYNFGLFADDDAKFMVGYRAMYQDYAGSDDKFEWDLTLHGPMTAFSLRF